MTKPVRIFWIVFFSGLAAFYLLIALISLGAFGRLPSLRQLENPTIMLASEVYHRRRNSHGKVLRRKGQSYAYRIQGYLVECDATRW